MGGVVAALHGQGVGRPQRPAADRQGFLVQGLGLGEPAQPHEAVAEVVLGLCEALVSGLAEPADRLGIILGHSLTLPVHVADPGLRAFEAS